mmetsp:Transcript_43725/g.102884  ORF Transcript_43725/g.102884 Transcript_43725/m.102884 type:complete len:237 (-) Transcript_43725:340-1050(-)
MDMEEAEEATDDAEDMEVVERAVMMRSDCGALGERTPSFARAHSVFETSLVPNFSDGAMVRAQSSSICCWSASRSIVAIEYNEPAPSGLPSIPIVARFPRAAIIFLSGSMCMVASALIVLAASSGRKYSTANDARSLNFSTIFLSAFTSNVVMADRVLATLCGLNSGAAVFARSVRASKSRSSGLIFIFASAAIVFDKALASNCGAAAIACSVRFCRNAVSTGFRILACALKISAI